MNYGNRTDWSFMLNESSCQDVITARFPRTSREAFGYSTPLCPRVTFLQRQRGGWLALLIVVAVIALAAFALA